MSKQIDPDWQAQMEDEIERETALAKGAFEDEIERDLAMREAQAEAYRKPHPDDEAEMIECDLAMREAQAEEYQKAHPNEPESDLTFEIVNGIIHIKGLR